MRAETLWQAFTSEYPDYQDENYHAWAYGASPDELARLTLQGIKRATTSGYAFYEIENEELPKVNQFNIILDSEEKAVCITQTTKVYLVPFNRVSTDHAYKEGECDRSYDYWRHVHIEFFEKEYASAGLTFTEDRLVVCEEFEVVYKN